MKLSQELTKDQITQQVEMAKYHLNVLRESLAIKKTEAFPYIAENCNWVDVLKVADKKLEVSLNLLNGFLQLYVVELEEMEL